MFRYDCMHGGLNPMCSNPRHHPYRMAQERSTSGLWITFNSRHHSPSVAPCGRWASLASMSAITRAQLHRWRSINSFQSPVFIWLGPPVTKVHHLVQPVLNWSLNGDQNRSTLAWWPVTEETRTANNRTTAKTNCSDVTWCNAAQRLCDARLNKSAMVTRKSPER